MALIEDMFKGGVPALLVGVGVALAAPILLPAAATGARPLAKALIKGALVVGDSVKEVVAEAGEQLSDLVAEVRAERTSNGTTTAGTTEPDGGHSRIITPS
jgi:multisubunit Na+/H+ antiporter MnhC subunit